MRALRIYAGPIARRHIDDHGLRPADVGALPAAAGGPKGLILGPLDRFLFGAWLADSSHPVHLVGASIGAWRMATPFLDNMVLLAPDPEWVRALPNGKLPDRTDFTRYGQDGAARSKVWARAAAESQRLADEFAQWVSKSEASEVLPL